MLVAVVLSLLVFLAWQLFFVDTKAVKPIAEEEPVVQKMIGTAEISDKHGVAGEVPPPRQDPGEEEPYKTAEIITVDTPLYQVRISEQGAVFQSFKLKEYRETIEKDAPPKELIGAEINMGTMRNGFAGDSVSGVSSGCLYHGSRYKCRVGYRQALDGTVFMAVQGRGHHREIVCFPAGHIPD